MAITWQSASAPDFGSSNRQQSTGLNRIDKGLQGIQDFAQGIADDKKKQSNASFQNELFDMSREEGISEKDFLARALESGRAKGFSPDQMRSQISNIQDIAQGIAEDNKSKSNAAFQNDLLNLSMDGSINEKEFLAKALERGRNRDLSPDQLMNQISSIQGVRSEASKLTEDQQMQFDSMSGAAESAQLQGADMINNRLREFDRNNPTGFVQGLQDEYGAGYSTGQALSELFGKLEDTQWFGQGSGKQLQEVFSKWQANNPDVSGLEVAEALKRTGIEKAQWWGNDEFNMDRFKNNLATVSKQFNKEIDNGTRRDALNTSLNNSLDSQIAQLQKQATEFYKGAKKDNLATVFNR